jgi:hypothetical protein
MSFFGFAGAPVDVEIRLAGEDERKIVEVKGEKEGKEMCPVFFDGESVEGSVSAVRGERGSPAVDSVRKLVLCLAAPLSTSAYSWRVAHTQVVVRVKDGKKFQHDGIRIELVGSIGESEGVDVGFLRSSAACARPVLAESISDQLVYWRTPRGYSFSGPSSIG